MFVVLAVVVVLWSSVWAAAWLTQQTLPRLGPTRRQRSRPTVSVVIPARNEVRDIANTLDDLLAQRGVDVEVIVVNDGSTDGTRELLEKMASEQNDLTVIHDPPLPNGWLGKVNAMTVGAAQATGDVLLFTDADVRFQIDAIASTVDFLDDEGLDFQTCLPHFEWQTVMEHAVVPGFIILLAQAQRWRVKQQRSRHAMGVGAFLMVRRQMYERVDGHRSLAMSSVDDLALAKLIKANGGRCDVALAADLLSIRMYKSNRDAFFAFSKNVLGLLGAAWPLGLLLPPFFGTIFWAGPVAVVVGFVAHDVRICVAGFVVYLIQLLSLLTLRPWHRVDTRIVFFFLNVVALTFAVLDATQLRARGKKQVAWATGRRAQTLNATHIRKWLPARQSCPKKKK